MRIRPMNQKDFASGARSVVQTRLDTISVMKVDRISENSDNDESQSAAEISFSFDKVLDSNPDTTLGKKISTQRDVFDSLGAQLVLNAMRGYNACVFAYGQTGSGKVRRNYTFVIASRVVSSLQISLSHLLTVVAHDDGK